MRTRTLKVARVSANAQARVRALRLSLFHLFTYYSAPSFTNLQFRTGVPHLHLLCFYYSYYYYYYMRWVASEPGRRFQGRVKRHPLTPTETQYLTPFEDQSLEIADRNCGLPGRKG